jgi:hypothetical protein
MFFGTMAHDVPPGFAAVLPPLALAARQKVAPPAFSNQDWDWSLFVLTCEMATFLSAASTNKCDVTPKDT